MMSSPPADPVRRILIIDDNRSIHDDFRKILGAASGDAWELDESEASIFGDGPETRKPRIPCEIDSAYQGHEGLECVRKSLAEGRPYAIAFVDVRMPPGWDGVRTTREIWAVDPEIQIVICTAFSDYTWDEMFGVIGDSANLVILKKPFDTVEALQLVHALSEKWRLHRLAVKKLDELEILVAGRTRELRESNEALRQSEALMRIAGRTARLGGWSVDLPGLLFNWTDEMCSIHELPPGTRIGSQEVFDFIAPQSRDACRVAFENCARDATPFDLEMDVVTSRGREIRVRTTGEARRDASGQIDRVHGACQDITERTRLAHQFLRAQRMESIGTLAGGIAHDLNNVLAPIMMSIELLKLKETDPGRLNILSIIQNSTRRGAEMVSQVLSFARGAKGESIQVRVGHLLSEIGNIVHDTFSKNIEVVSHIPADLWAVQGDATQLHQVLLNLCVNARDAMPDGGILTLSARNAHLDDHYAAMNGDAISGPYVFIEVEDNGCGIPPEMIDEIFDPFFTTKEIGKGTGLGLSTSLGIIKSHGGFIRVQSEPGKGTQFHLSLPALVGTSLTRVAESPVEPVRGNGELILVVDDEIAVRQITRETLEAYGYRVVLASDGAESVAIFASHHKEISAVLTDLMMPTMDGHATIPVLKKINPSVPIIATSGVPTQGAAARLQVNHFLAKPYTAENLLQVLKDLLPGSRFGNGL